ncbi:unnamed protein product [Durusdinium trenchii]|uniref:Uncharacterized protein n=2 Tax=Durusdinium trenchii TaxID=1381693 RepID=A0ABP0RU14_9DINO
MLNSRTPTLLWKTWGSPLVSAWEVLTAWPCMEWQMAMESAGSCALLSYVDIFPRSWRNPDTSQKVDWMQPCMKLSCKLSCSSNPQAMQTAQQI